LLLLHELPPASAGGISLRGRLEPKSKKFFILAALAKALRKCPILFLAQADTCPANLRLKPEAIDKKPEEEDEARRMFEKSLNATNLITTSGT